MKKFCVYQRFGPGFGDIINGLCKAIIQTQRRQEKIVYVSTQGKPDIASKRVAVCKEFLEELELPKGMEVKFVDKPGSMDHLGGFVQRNFPYLRTKVKWKFNPKSDLICYVFDSGSRASRMKGKYFLKEEKDCLKEAMDRTPFQFVQLGEHHSIKEDIYFLSESLCYIGIEGGGAHLSTRVGTPTFCKYWRYNLRRECRHEFRAEQYQPRAKYFYSVYDVIRLFEYLQEDKSICQNLLV